MDWVLLSGMCFHDLTFRFEGAAVLSEPGSVSRVLEVSSHGWLLHRDTPPTIPTIQRGFFFSVVKLLLSALGIFALLLFSHWDQCLLVIHVDER